MTDGVFSPAWRRIIKRRFVNWAQRHRLASRLEIACALLALILGGVSYAILADHYTPSEGFTPRIAALLLAVNLVPILGLVILITRRLIRLFAHQRKGEAGSRLHMRFVVLFAMIATIPTLLVIIFASLLFQVGVQFWFSDRVRDVIENADSVAQAYLVENKRRIVGDIVPMAGDVVHDSRIVPITSADFKRAFENQILLRGLSEATIFTLEANKPKALISTVLTGRTLDERLSSSDIQRALQGQIVTLSTNNDRVDALMALDMDKKATLFLYVSRKVDPAILSNANRSRTALSDYRQLIERSYLLQKRFNAILAVIAIVILAIAIWFALWLANRFVAPIRRLANVADRLGQGDFDARATLRGTPDEFSAFSRAFNKMARQIQIQRNELVATNLQLDRRSQFTEAVLSGVSAGVLSISEKGRVRLANQSAAKLLARSDDQLVGHALAQSVPELAGLLDEAKRKGTGQKQVNLDRPDGEKTLVARISHNADGYVLTFDDISAQLADQRQAAWADIAQRIAHEIKNPLTPIQLSAERLQRKYGKQIHEDKDTFIRMTQTIVRQVGDLRRMVDEFSSFARMPKPVFHPEPLLEIIQDALSLQQFAHTDIDFHMHAPSTGIIFSCDRPQISQAILNLLKNAAEAIQARQETGLEGQTEKGQIDVSVTRSAAQIVISIEDNGVGLPVDKRGQLMEPYVTTREGGTGLGLAIVKKIVAEHRGELELMASASGGAVARIIFDTTTVFMVSDESNIVKKSAE